MFYKEAKSNEQLVTDFSRVFLADIKNTSFGWQESQMLLTPNLFYEHIFATHNNV